jgi:hypothetical protein
MTKARTGRRPIIRMAMTLGGRFAHGGAICAAMERSPGVTCEECRCRTATSQRWF